MRSISDAADNSAASEKRYQTTTPPELAIFIPYTT